MDILELVPDEQPTTWCTNPVIAPKKNEKISFCSNMRAPNTVIKRPISEAMTAEDVKINLCHTTVFSKLDMREWVGAIQNYNRPWTVNPMQNDR